MLDSKIDLKPGASRFLSCLAGLQIPRGVATSSSGKKARCILEKVGLWQYITHLTGGDEVKASKPAPDIYLDVANKLRIAPSRCIAFEDSETGATAALQAGMRVVQIPDLVAAERPQSPPQFFIAKNLLKGAALLGIKL